MTADIPVLPNAAKNLAPVNDPVIGRVVSNNSCMKGKSASFVRHTEIDVSGTPLEGNCLVVQSFGVIAPGKDPKGKLHKVRLYSIACPSYGEDGEGKIISTTPKRLIDEFNAEEKNPGPTENGLFLGVCSNYLCKLEPGDEVKLTGPSGKRFLLPVDRDKHDYVFIATGTGIAPFRGMVMELLFGQMEKNTMESGKTAKATAPVPKYGRMVENILENSKMTNQVAKELLFTLTAQSMLVSGWTEKDMGTEL